MSGMRCFDRSDRLPIQGFKTVSSELGLFPPGTDGLFIVRHQGILEGGCTVEERTQCFEKRSAVFAEDRRYRENFLLRIKNNIDLLYLGIIGFVDLHAS